MIISQAYDELDSTTFQSLISALLVVEYPDVQCMPLRGRDGGRDAISAASRSGNSIDAIVFQVKQRQPDRNHRPSVSELFTWIEKNLQLELPKIARQAKRGVQKYVLVTNIAASGDLDSGLRDKVIEHLRKVVPIPAVAWFHEDITIRLKAQPQIALTHGLLWGSNDIVGVLAAKPEESIRKSTEFSPIWTALTSYLKKQYKDERNLRFRQVGFDRVDLIDSFTDVPLTLKHNSSVKSRREWSRQILDAKIDVSGRDTYGGGTFRSHDLLAGAAALLLHSSENRFRVCLIEGAPGQGKSTFTQYVCQVHRIRILGKEGDGNRLALRDKYASQRLPFRVELRKYAAWIQERQRSHVAEVGVLDYLTASLKSVSEINVSTESLVSVVRETPTLLVFDGLDEVPELETRRIVVERIESICENLDAWECDSQVAVTSRPSTALNLPTLDDEDVVRLQLVALPASIIFEYADRWIKLREMPEDEVEDFKTIFKSAVSRPHVTDLARNPMQLAILLYLISAKGWSLPDKRTDLYQAYIDTFIDREAEKSAPVRENANLLLELHGYMAWILQSRAELSTSDSSGGDISTEELKSIFRKYLEFEGRSIELIDSLFSGTERVFVLVERDQGRWEFEVQPLREFFAGRYLYQSAPDDRASLEVAGGKPERLEALLRNPYWTNVLRFYCGYYQKGELPDLARRMCDFIDAAEAGERLHAIATGEAVLRDYSLASSQRDTNHLVSTLAQATSLPVFARSANVDSFENPPMKLVDGLGRQQLVSCVRAQIWDQQDGSTADRLAELIEANDPHPEKWWIDSWNAGIGVAERYKFLRVGVLSGALSRVPLSELETIVSSPSIKENCHTWTRLIEAGRADYFTASHSNFSLMVSALFNGPSTHLLKTRDGGDVPNWMRFVSEACTTSPWVRFNGATWRFQRLVTNESSQIEDKLETSAKVQELVSVLSSALLFRQSTSSGKLEGWSSAVRVLANYEPESWLAWKVSLLAAEDLKAHKLEKVEISHSLRVALRWVENGSSRDIEDAKQRASFGYRMASCAAIIGSFSTDEMLASIPLLESMLSSFTDAELHELRYFLAMNASIDGRSLTRHRTMSRSEVDLVTERSVLLGVFCLPRIRVADRLLAEERILETEASTVGRFVNAEASFILARRLRPRRGRSKVLKELAARSAHTSSWINTMSSTRAHGPLWGRFEDPDQLMRQVLSDPRSYPWDLIAVLGGWASDKFRDSIFPLRRSSDAENWFPHDVDRQGG